MQNTVLKQIHFSNLNFCCIQNDENWNYQLKSTDYNPPGCLFYKILMHISNKLTKKSDIIKIFNYLFVFKEEKKEGEEDKPKVEDVGEDEDEDKADKDKKKKKTIKVCKVHIFRKGYKILRKYLKSAFKLVN